MKTFFVALILGIFVGLFINNYFADPEAYTKLKEAKHSLFEEPDQENLAAAEPELPIEQPEPARFEVASKELNADSSSAATDAPSTPQPLPKPDSPAATPEDADAPQDKQSPNPEAEKQAPEPAPLTPKQKAEKLVEDGVEKAAEIAETVSEKVKDATKEAKPKIEQGIDTSIDTTLAIAIRGQYKLEKRINASNLQISVKDRIATLAGHVPSEDIKQLAIEIAVFTKGIDGVEESLEIRP